MIIGNLHERIDDEGLRNAFACFGRIIDARVIRNIGAARSCGYGFVTFVEEEASDLAMVGMDGRELQGIAITVARASSRRLQKYPTSKRPQGRKQRR